MIAQEQNPTPPTPTQARLDVNGRRRIVVILIYMTIEAAVLFAAAGTLAWLNGWALVGLRLLSTLVAGVIIIRINPEVINERGRKKENDNTKWWDKVFAAVYLPLVVIIPIVAGLDFRYGWTAVPVALQIASVALLLPAMVLPYWAMAVNRNLETTVRIQDDRGHQVCTDGPYRFVRHPMYLGAVALYLGMPLLLDSWWTAVPTGIALLAVVMRTALEDRTLRAELPGYRDYAQETRYRLIPGVW